MVFIGFQYVLLDYLTVLLFLITSIVEANAARPITAKA